MKVWFHEASRWTRVIMNMIHVVKHIYLDELLIVLHGICVLYIKRKFKHMFLQETSWKTIFFINVFNLLFPLYDACTCNLCLSVHSVLHYMTYCLSCSLFKFISIKFHMFVIEINEELLKWYLIHQFISHCKEKIINVHWFFPFNVIGLNTGY